VKVNLTRGFILHLILLALRAKGIQITRIKMKCVQPGTVFIAQFKLSYLQTYQIEFPVDLVQQGANCEFSNYWMIYEVVAAKS
jgi:hypothetical protein